MSEQIVKVEIDPRDRDCIQITLRHIPKSSFFNREKTSHTALYKGHGNNWYCVPSFKLAPTSLLPLLKAISYSHQYKHLRCHLNPPAKF